MSRSVINEFVPSTSMVLRLAALQAARAPHSQLLIIALIKRYISDKVII